MKRFFIKDISYDVSHEPPYIVVVGVDYNDGSEKNKLIIDFVDGVDELPTFVLTGQDDDYAYEGLKYGDDDGEFNDYIDALTIEEFEGIPVSYRTTAFSELFFAYKNYPENPAANLISYICALAFVTFELAFECDKSEMMEKLIESGKGKYADEIEIPDEIMKDFIIEFGED